MNPGRTVLQSIVLAALCIAAMSTNPVPSSAGDKPFRIGYHFTQEAARSFKVEYNQEYEVKGYSFYTLIDLKYTETCVESHEDTLYTMEITIDDVSAQLRRNDDLIDSGLDEDMKGKTFRFNIDRHGILSGIQAKDYLEQEDDVMNIVQTMLMGSYPYLPDSVVDVDGEWTFDGRMIRDLKTTMDVKSHSLFKVDKYTKEKGRECALVKRTGKNHIGGRIENQNGTFVLDGEGDSKAEFFFDGGNGCVIKVKSESTAEVTSIDASGGSAGEREAYKSNVSYTFKKELK